MDLKNLRADSPPIPELLATAASLRMDALAARLPHLCAQRPAVGHRLQGVAREVPEDLPHAFRVGPSHQRLLWQVLFERVPVENLGAVAQEREGLAQRLAQVCLN